MTLSEPVTGKPRAPPSVVGVSDGASVVVGADGATMEAVVVAPFGDVVVVVDVVVVAVVVKSAAAPASRTSLRARENVLKYWQPAL
jgi:hypothetical protein